MSEVKNGKYEENGVITYYKNGLLHCEDGPAEEWNEGYMYWYLNGVEYTEEEFNQWLIKKELNEKLQSTLKLKPKEKKKKI